MCCIRLQKHSGVILYCCGAEIGLLVLKIDLIKNQYEIKMGPIYCFNTHSCLIIYQCTLFYRTKARTSFPYLLIMQSIQIKTIPYFWGKRIFCHYLLAVALSSSAECLIYFFFSIKIKPMRTGTVKL